MTWRKSSRSGGNGNCAEVAELTGAVAVRDSKDPGGPVLLFDPAAWQAFVEGAKHGELIAEPEEQLRAPVDGLGALCLYLNAT